MASSTFSAHARPARRRASPPCSWKLGDLGVGPDVVGHVVAVAVARRQVAADVPEFLEVVVLSPLAVSTPNGV